ncbi:MAG: tRNA (adenosine(37)-N6)-threonylcarbamoyltransferase complex dimerization subunit type 1 TsaB [Oscillospiraceae bacterium]|jgi:tRNA threonylcarbamoyladenosine biosynthesis protein TsaB|nr:tRNA (adenosine(37)-N6)-threonylcarbamoyltransferase complex dimerization subunit type 1 TsaB [Oscillospiraceae bacterium]
MTILALECAAKAAGAAVLHDGTCVSECFAASGRTHSETLIPLTQAALSAAGITCEEVDAFAITAGPGSFTGVRIGIAAVKGMALPLDKPCAAVSSLEAAAYNMLGRDCLVLPIMDARCQQVYAALFRVRGARLERLMPDSAIKINDLTEKLRDYNEPLVCVGDGSELMTGLLDNITMAPEHLRLPRAFGTALCAYHTQQFVTVGELLPVYLRIPQAERILQNQGIIKL